MTTYTYIGYGTTDNNGIATLDHDSEGNTLTHSYTGSSAGKIDIVASLDNPITNSSLVSETYSIYDCSSYDSGVYGSAVNQYWLSSTTYLSRTVETDNTGTTFSNSNTSSTMYAYLLPPNVTATSVTTSCVYTTDDYAIECDIIDYDGSIALTIRGTTGNLIRQYLEQLSQNTTFHVKLEVKNGIGKYYIDGSSTPAYTSSVTDLSTEFGVRLEVGASASVKIKNFKVYQI